MHEINNKAQFDRPIENRENSARATYSAPVVAVQSLVLVTQGGTPGGGDSGDTGSQDPLTGG